jgi:hypothetical protein
MSETAGYFDGLNEKLLSALPPAARSVVEFGCGNGRLGAAYKARNSGTRWTGIEINTDAAALATRHLDAVIVGNAESIEVARIGGDHDLVIFGDVLERLRDPGAFLALCHEISAPDARLVCCVPNMGHVSVVERMLAGDLSYDAAGLLNSTHLRLFSWASIYKLLLDAGWLPNLADGYYVSGSDEALMQHLVSAASSVGIPAWTAQRNLLLYQLVIDCVKSPPAAQCASPSAFRVVVPVNRRSQFDLNVARSPGVHEVGAEVIVVENAATPGTALAAGSANSPSPWILFCHQDVYLPRGSGRALANLLGLVPPDQAPLELFGFAGLAANPDGGTRMAGLVIDRVGRFDHPAASNAVSIDEVAMVVHKNSVHEIDPNLGWHAWATDLCLATQHGRATGHARIARVPIFHNSYTDYQVPKEWSRSAALLLAKYPGVASIPTLCGEVNRPR